MYRLGINNLHTHSKQSFATEFTGNIKFCTKSSHKKIDTKEVTPDIPA